MNPVAVASGRVGPALFSSKASTTGASELRWCTSGRHERAWDVIPVLDPIHLLEPLGGGRLQTLPAELPPFVPHVR